jgi:hypothetical protein
VARNLAENPANKRAKIQYRRLADADTG